MSNLWSGQREAALLSVEPLASRMRPRTLDDFAGQLHLLGTQNGAKPLLRRMIEGRSLTSIILHGPPGTGKTSLASVIANSTESHFVKENAANVSVKRIREIIDEAADRLATSRKRTILFLDEIHRFSKSQQDVLLEDVERGRIILIGATTENPMFAVNSALVSRSTVFRLESLNEQDIERLIRRAIADPDLGYGKLPLDVADDAIRHWATISDGDARRALTALEVAVKSAGGEAAKYSSDPRPIHIDLQAAEQSIQHKAIVYSGDGDQHYDTISAFIKSIRGSDPDAAIYWLALMLEAGEDPRFIARRLAILASEDIGNADPRAIMVADATWSLVERIGMPEGRITLAQCVTYLALASKSNASYNAINAAMEDVKEGRTRAVPIELRDPNKVKSVGSAVEGKGYEYSHDSSVRTSIGGVTGQSYMGVDKRYYTPEGIGSEEVLKRRLDEVRAARRNASP